MDKKRMVVDEIMELERETYRLFKAGEVEPALSLMSEDVMFFNPESEILKGKESEKEMLLAAINTEGLELSWEPTDVHVSPSGDMAYAYGLMRIKMPEVDEKFEKYITIWEKIEGQWKLILQMRNANS